MSEHHKNKKITKKNIKINTYIHDICFALFLLKIIVIVPLLTTADLF